MVFDRPDGYWGVAPVLPHDYSDYAMNRYADHIPLDRQSEMYEREGLDLDRSTLAGWVGGVSAAIAPLLEQLRR